MLKIRLTRKGKKNSAFFRVVVAEHTSPIKGKFLENLGFLNPHTKEKEFKADRIKYWIEKGAQCSDTVHNLLVSNGVIGGPKRAVKLKKKIEEKKEEAEAAKPAEKKDEAKEPVSEEAAASEAEKKPEEIAETKPEKKEIEKSAEVKEEKKEEKKVEDAKPVPEKKEAEEEKK
ncbi:MAG: 30S ribosomal protein S16 [Candidatus Moranbacteria bacterium]|nr:30S ribosomal protein S16 [Candidatus Moranbacteria bacterium]